MKTALGVWGALVLTICIFPIDGSDVESEPLNLMDLPVELRLEILENLDINTLLFISKTISDESNLIDTVFRTLYQRHAFVVYEYQGEVRISYRKIRVATITRMDDDFKNFMEFLEIFGHNIKKFEFSFDSSVDKNLRDSVCQLISKYVAEFVNEIVFKFNSFKFQLNDQSLNHFNFTFPNAKIVKIWQREIEPAILRQMFPSVSNLDIQSLEMEESLGHFPQMERLGLNYFRGIEKNLREFEQTLAANPQLKHLFIQDCRRWDILETLSEIRPDLESLEIGNLNFNDPETVAVPLRFANMKMFKCISFSINQRPVNRIPFEFGNLREIEFDRTDLADYWIDIMKQNKDLRKITLLHFLRREHLLKIASELPSLEELYMEYHSGDPKSVRDIVDFLQSATQLKKATFHWLFRRECAEVAQHLNGKWKNVNESMAHCNFVRN